MLNIELSVFAAITMYNSNYYWQIHFSTKKLKLGDMRF